mmetsp:Transcript_72914/g.152229  ORF Transcript_72914/g.152229 Transcript_72914/m.152229 type:complete len:277 (+) Transcript_72914:904-1734(+)
MVVLDPDAAQLIWGHAALQIKASAADSQMLGSESQRSAPGTYATIGRQRSEKGGCCRGEVHGLRGLQILQEPVVDCEGVFITLSNLHHIGRLCDLSHVKVGRENRVAAGHFEECRTSRKTSLLIVLFRGEFVAVDLMCRPCHLIAADTCFACLLALVHLRELHAGDASEAHRDLQFCGKVTIEAFKGEGSRQQGLPNRAREIPKLLEGDLRGVAADIVGIANCNNSSLIVTNKVFFIPDRNNEDQRKCCASRQAHEARTRGSLGSRLTADASSTSS